MLLPIPRRKGSLRDILAIPCYNTREVIHMNDIGKNIKVQRIRRNLTQDDLAEKLFVTRQTVSNYETGKTRPDVQMLMAIAQVLQIPLDNLLYEPESAVLRRRRIGIVCILGLVMLALYLGLSRLCDYTLELRGQTYEAAPQIYVTLLLVPLYFTLLGYTVMGSVRFIQQARPLVPKKRRIILVAAFTGLLAVFLPRLNFLLVLSQLPHLPVPDRWYFPYSLFFSRFGTVSYLLLGLLLGAASRWKQPELKHPDPV